MQNDFQDTEQLAQLIGKKHSVLQELRDKSRHQADLIRQQDMDQLMSVLAAKQVLLGELQQLESQLDPFRNQDPERRDWRTTERRNETRMVAEQCDALLQEALLLDKQSESLMKKRRDETAEKLDGVHKGGEATRAYGQGTSNSGGVNLDVSS